MKKIILITNLLILIFFLSGCINDDEDYENSFTLNTNAEELQRTNSELEAEGPPLTNPEIQLETVGDKNITVDSYEIKISSVTKKEEGTVGGRETRGQFIIIYLTVKNVGKEEISITGSRFLLIDEEENKYEGELGCGSFIWIDLNPKLSEDFCVSFDVPKETEKFYLKIAHGFLGNDKTDILEILVK